MNLSLPFLLEQDWLQCVAASLVLVGMMMPGTVFFNFRLQICLAFATENFTLHLKTQYVFISSSVCFSPLLPGKEKKAKKNYRLQAKQNTYAYN